MTLAQIDPRVGDVSWNRQLIQEKIAQAKLEGCDLLVFPELAILGYPPRDLLDYPSIIDENLAALEQIKTACDGITVIVGYVERNTKTTGKPFFNSAAVFQDRKQIQNYRKWLLPYYDVFEEERYFEPGTERAVFLVKGKKIALTLCEDLWNEPGYLARGYEKKPLAEIRPGEVDLVVNLSASPFHLGKKQLREELFKKIATQIQAPIAYCNQVGANDELIFDGQSFVIDSQGILVEGKPFQPDDIHWVLGGNQKPTASKAGHQETKKKANAKASQWNASQWLMEALALGIRDYVKKSSLKTVCLGLSGGIDSSVTACLAVKALGAKQVFGLALPSKFNAPHGLDDATRLADQLGISLQTLPIDVILEAFQQTLLLLQQLTNREGSSLALNTLTLENIQPRIRMTLLMAFANQHGHLVLNTSNKSEIATGYSTLYGDTAGALAVLGDLTKHQVYDLARQFNTANLAQTGTELIPSRILTRAPSAELRENQTDQQTLPPYDILDAIVEAHMEHSLTKSGLSQLGYSDEVLRKVETLNTLSEFKRRQFPPILRVSPKAFGMGRRIPIVGRKPLQ